MTVPVCFYESGAGQDGQVLGDCLAGDGQLGGQRCRRGLAGGADEIEFPAAGGVCDCRPELLILALRLISLAPSPLP